MKQVLAPRNLLIVAALVLTALSASWAQSAPSRYPSARTAMTTHVRIGPRDVMATAVTPGTHFFTFHGRTFEVDYNGRLIGVYQGSLYPGTLTAETEAVPDSQPGRTSYPGRGYDQATALRQERYQIVTPPTADNPVVGTNQILVGAGENAFLPTLYGSYGPSYMSAYVYNPYFTFPLPPNATVGTPLPGQVPLGAASGTSMFGSGVTASPFTPPAIAPFQSLTGQVPITGSGAPGTQNTLTPGIPTTNIGPNGVPILTPFRPAPPSGSNFGTGTPPPTPVLPNATR